MNLMDENFMEQVKERERIDATHSWLYRCFPPQSTVCSMCGADRMDPNLVECRFGLSTVD